MNISELENKIAVIKKGIDSPATPENQKELFKKTLVTLEKQLEDAKSKETKTEAPKKKRVKKERTPSVAEKKRGIVSKMDVSKDKASVTYKGKTYSIDECDDLFKAWNMKKKAAAKSSEKSESKPTTEKILDKSETTLKQVLADKSVKKKIKENPKQAKRELVKVEKTMRAFLDAVEEFLGKKIPESKVNKVFAFFKEIDLMEMGGALTYADVYEGNMAEFADGGVVGEDFNPKSFTLEELHKKISSQDIEIQYLRWNNPNPSPYNSDYEWGNVRTRHQWNKIKNWRLTISDYGQLQLDKGGENLYLTLIVYKENEPQPTSDTSPLLTKGMELSIYSKENHKGLKDFANQIIKKMAHGGEVGISHYKVGDAVFVDYMDAVNYCDENNLPYSKIIKTKKYANGGSMSDDTPKIYVADLAAYNNGKLIGEWLDLSDYDSGEEVMDAISELLEKWSKESGEEREEFAIHDYENFDSSLYSEYMGEGDFDMVIKSYKVSKEKGIPMSVISNIMSQYSPDDLSDWVDDRYEGEFNSDEDLAYHYVDMIGGLENVGQDTLERYFDYESFGRDLSYDYTEIDGHYFRTYKKGGSIKKYDLNKYMKKK
jgi:antirestriction protein